MTAESSGWPLGAAERPFCAGGSVVRALGRTANRNGSRFGMRVSRSGGRMPVNRRCMRAMLRCVLWLVRLGCRIGGLIFANGDRLACQLLDVAPEGTLFAIAKADGDA